MATRSEIERPAPDRRARLAQAIVRLVSKAVMDPAVLRIELDGAAPGPATGQPPAGARVVVGGPDALARLLWPPTPDAFAEAYLRGDIELDGDLRDAIDASQALDPRRLSPVEARRLLRWMLELRRTSAPGQELRRVARLTGARHSRARDIAAIRFHYDVGEDFFRLWLDRRLTYSCAYFARADDPAADLDAAQEAKLELICRKLRLQAGMRLLDIGCGWGSLIQFAAKRHGVEAVGVTLSERQAGEANRRAAAAGLSGQVRAEVRDYRDLAPLGTFDAVASVGMFEHVGAANLATYFRSAHAALAPGGLFLNHGIARARRPAGERAHLRPGASRFVGRYVFPDGELVPLEAATAIARYRVGFDLVDVQLLRPHYALTLAAWVGRLEANWDAAVAAAGEEVARTWRLYMSAARLGFERGDLEVAQLLLARAVDGRPVERPLRPWW